MIIKQSSIQPPYISFFVSIMEKDPCRGLYTWLFYDHPYLVSLLFAVLISLHLVTFLMFFITCYNSNLILVFIIHFASMYSLLFVSSGNHTPGSRSYSDLVDTWVDSACIHQLVLVQKLPVWCRWVAYNSFQTTHMTCDDHAVLDEQTMAARGKTECF